MSKQAVDLDETFSEEWEEIKRRHDMSGHDRLADLINAADDAETLFEVTRQTRMSRIPARGALSWFGLASDDHGAHQWPIPELDDNIEQLRRGELPDGCRAAEWRGERDE